MPNPFHTGDNGVSRSATTEGQTNRQIDDLVIHQFRMHAQELEQLQRQIEQGIVPTNTPRSHTIREMTSADIASHVASGSHVDRSNTLSPRDFEDNPRLSKNIHMLQKLDINNMRYYDESVINALANRSIPDDAKIHFSNFMRGINEIKRYNDYEASSTCICACKTIDTVKFAANALYDTFGEMLPQSIKSTRIVLNFAEKEYDIMHSF